MAGGVKPPPERLYGRTRTHALRPRQRLLLDVALPRLRLTTAEQPGVDFANPPAELWLEVGFGGGEHARALAQENPAIGLIAAEVFEQGLCSMLAALVPEGGEASAPLPGNLRLWDDDARVLLRRLPDAALSRLMLMFPDPWPKPRHAKRRFVHPEIARLAASKLRPGGVWRIASDDPTYQDWVCEVMGAQPDFTCTLDSPSRPEGWPATRYEAKAHAAGRQPRYWVFTRN